MFNKEHNLLIMPNKIISGETIKYIWFHDLYPTDTFNMVITIVGKSSKLTNNPESTGTIYNINIDTSTLIAGLYAYQVTLSDGVTTDLVEYGQLIVEKNLANLTILDCRMHAEKMLEAIQALIEGRATNEHKSLKVNNRELVLHSFKELTTLKDYYTAEIARKRVRQNRRFKSAKVRFDR